MMDTTGTVPLLSALWFTCIYITSLTAYFKRREYIFIGWLLLAVLDFYEKHFDSWRCPWIVFAHKLCIKYTDKHKLPLDAQSVIIYIYQIQLIILFDSFIFLVVSSHKFFNIFIGDKMKMKSTGNPYFFIIFVLFALIIYQVDACSSTKENGKVGVSPQLKATPIGSGRCSYFLIM